MKQWRPGGISIAAQVSRHNATQEIGYTFVQFPLMRAVGALWVRRVPSIADVMSMFRWNSPARNAPRLSGTEGLVPNGVTAKKLRKNELVPIAATAHTEPPKIPAKPEAVHNAPTPTPRTNAAVVLLKKKRRIACILRISALRFLETVPPEKRPWSMLLRKASTPLPAKQCIALPVTCKPN